WFAAAPAFTSGHRYSVKSRGVNKAGNTETLFTVGVNTVTFTFDNTPPSASLLSPVAVQLNALATVSGTAADNVGLAQVQARIRNNAVGAYWQPGTFSPVTFNIASDADPSAWFNASGTVSWSTGTFPAAFFTSGLSYSVGARSIDQ